VCLAGLPTRPTTGRPKNVKDRVQYTNYIPVFISQVEVNGSCSYVPVSQHFFV
jgi:hypothetical protein